MKNKLCYLFVFDGYSDWEPALAVAGLQQFTDFEVQTFSLDGKAITSAGNLTIVPKLSLPELDTADLIIIPGGAAWAEGKNREITPFIKEALGEGKTVAAICDATLYMAAEGFLDNIRHTSNDLGLLQQAVPSYKGEANYVQKGAVRDKQVITANGTAGVSFAREIFDQFGELEKNEGFAFWFGFFHKPEFAALK